jgi:hypothetical protein
MKLCMCIVLSLAVGFVLGTVLHPLSVRAQGASRIFIDETTPRMTFVVPHGDRVVGFTCLAVVDVRPEQNGVHCFVASQP